MACSTPPLPSQPSAANATQDVRLYNTFYRDILLFGAKNLVSSAKTIQPRARCISNDIDWHHVNLFLTMKGSPSDGSGKTTLEIITTFSTAAFSNSLVAGGDRRCLWGLNGATACQCVSCKQE